MLSKILTSLALLVSSFFNPTMHFGAYAPISTNQGGTGTTTAPTYGKVLLGNSNGNYDLAATSTLGISGGSGSPGGSDTQVQFNSSGSFGGDANFVWDNTQKYLNLGISSGTGVINFGPDGNTSNTFISGIQNDLDLEAYGTGGTVNINAGGAQTELYMTPSLFKFYNLANGQFQFFYTGSRAAIIDSSLITVSSKTFTFPDWTGNFLVGSSTSLFQTATGAVGVGTSSPIGSFAIQGVSSGSATKGTCFRAKDVGANTFTYWWFKAGVQTVQTANCGGVGTTTITMD